MQYNILFLSPLAVFWRKKRENRGIKPNKKKPNPWQSSLQGERFGVFYIHFKTKKSSYFLLKFS